MTTPMTCPLCENRRTNRFARDQTRVYFRCETCGLIFVPESDHLSADQEKARYNTHRNNPEDKGYTTFLSTLFLPMMERLTPGARGLDFGSGPGPTLSGMFEDAGFPMKIYDPYFANDPRVFQQKFDFVSASEVAEHLYHPGREFHRLFRLLNPGGILGIMTGMVPCDSDFMDWYYKNDPTHVCFYSEQTFQWLVSQWTASIEVFTDKIVIIRKPNLSVSAGERQP